jgi:hypothetical protein
MPCRGGVGNEGNRIGTIEWNRGGGSNHMESENPGSLSPMENPAELLQKSAGSQRYPRASPHSTRDQPFLWKYL